MIWAALLLVFGCESGGRDHSSAIKPTPPGVVATDVRVDVLDYPTLSALEAQGFSLSALLGADVEPARLSALNTASPAWAALSGAIMEDVDGLIAQVRLPLVTDHREAKRWPAGNVGRALDTAWLQSQEGRFVLAGVVNRLDRRDLHSQASCGEVRFIYRLAYEVDQGKSGVSSRLPFSMNVVMRPTEAADCGAVARGWVGLPDAPTLAKSLVEGPLNREQLTLDRIEINAQIVRLPSGLETEFAGQAIYLLKVYTLRETEAGWEATPQPLENTPDVMRLQSDPVLLSELKTWILENIDAIDQGTYLIPERLLAESSLSYSTLGMNRIANKPFSQLLSGWTPPLPEDPSRRFIGDARGLVERLDNGSCIGCHQAGATAGFHLLGPDAPELTGVTNRLAVTVSPHLGLERERRRHYVAAVASGTQVDVFRPHSLMPADGGVMANQPCVPASSSGAIVGNERWSCRSSGRCEVLVSEPKNGLSFGQCIPEQDDLLAGMSCRRVEITPTAPTPRTSPWNLHRYADEAKVTPIYTLPEAPPFAQDSLHCRPTRIGVPLGRTYRRCTAAERGLSGFNTEGPLPQEICAVIGGAKFDLCVEGDFHECLDQIIGRGMVASCSIEHPCREDAICQALPWQLSSVPSTAGQAVAEAGVGFCTPTYFLFQLRLDGHPQPTLASVGI